MWSNCYSFSNILLNIYKFYSTFQLLVVVKNHEIVKNSLIVIKDFSVDSLLETQISKNDLDEITNDFFSKLRKGLPGTPSRMRGNIFDKKRKAEKKLPNKEGLFDYMFVS